MRNDRGKIWIIPAAALVLALVFGIGGMAETRNAAASAAEEIAETPEGETTEPGSTCFLTVSCETLLDHTENLDPEKIELLPSDGVIFARAEVAFYEGESVFHVLQREMQQNKIHLEFVQIPAYHSAYIEGIGNIYEFDCGELSGWMYRVNGLFPGYGSGGYEIAPGDEIQWVYTCDLGRDVGNTNGIPGGN